METKYNLLTRLLKNIKNVVTPDGNVAGSGGSGGMLVVHETVTTETVPSSGEDAGGTFELHTLDKTWQEIHDADVAFISKDYDENGETGSLIKLIAFVYTDGSTYGVGSENVNYTTSDPDGYPAIQRIDDGGTE